jgi:hypothetical protein
MKKGKYLLATLIFIAVYLYFVAHFKIVVNDQSDIIIGTTFFFTLFIGYFITRQNDRYSKIADNLTTNDGYFSYLYRISGMAPRIQNELREIARKHYEQILKSGDLAYHVKHPSTTITDLTKSLASITKQEIDLPAAEGAWGFCFEVISDLQLTRKKILNLYAEKLVAFQWAVVYILGLLLMISFNFVPSDSWYVVILKVAFGTAVFISIILLKQLDNLTLFGDTVGMDSVKDVMNILDEKDAANK